MFSEMRFGPYFGVSHLVDLPARLTDPSPFFAPFPPFGEMAVFLKHKGCKLATMHFDCMTAKTELK